MTASLRTIAAVAVLALGLPSAVLAQDSYPSKPIKLIVAFPPGGASDLTGRLLAEKMGAILKQSVIVDNRSGANGVLGADLVAKAAPDGYTILLTDRGGLGINPSLYAKLPYDPATAFAFVGIATEGPYVLVANPGLNVSTVKELAAAAKAKPGSIAYGSWGVGSMAQMNMEVLSRTLGITLLHVPYKGASGAVQAAVAGDVGVTIATAPAALGFIKDGRLRALAVGSPQRLPLLPDVPTLAEAGFPGDILAPTFFALAVPAATPPAIVARLHDAMRAALASPDVVEKLAANGLVPSTASSAASAATVKQDMERFGALTRTIGIVPE